MHEPAHTREAGSELDRDIVDAEGSSGRGCRGGVDAYGCAAYTRGKNDVFEEDDADEFFLTLPAGDEERRAQQRVDALEERRPVCHYCRPPRGRESFVSRREQREVEHEVPGVHVAGTRGKPEMHGYRVGLVGDHGGGGEREVGCWGLIGAEYVSLS